MRLKNEEIIEARTANSTVTAPIRAIAFKSAGLSPDI
jgi:hypothetical protein